MNIRERLQTLRTTLLVPAAEYVPAISDALDQIDQMLADTTPPAPAGRTLTEALEALRGLLDIEDVRIATGAFKPNDEAATRIARARAILASSTPTQSAPEPTK